MTLNSTPLERLFARLAGELSSQTLKLDPTSYPRLDALAGTRVRFDILPPAVPGFSDAAAEPRTLLLIVQPDALVLEAGSTEQAHAVVTGTLPGIARLFLRPSAANTADVRLEGDEAALQSVAALFQDLEPDLAEPLAGVIGREAADGLIGAAEAGFAFLRSAAEGLATGARKEAGNAWVTDQARNTLMDRLDDLRLRVDRLDARIGLVEARKSESKQNAP